ncbi:MAG: hypothetical protein H6737_23960 [Alphaproteobacteria bacterium]|nr:hypothetical protein [Alphaproteobacteria bacterium]
MTLALALAFSNPAFARPSEAKVTAKLAADHCVQTGSGIYDRDAAGRITEWRVSAECTEGDTLHMGMYGWTPDGDWTFKKWYHSESRTTGPLPPWDEVEMLLRHEGLSEMASAMFGYSWGPVVNLQYAQPPVTNYRNPNYVSFEVVMEFTMNKSRDKTNPMMRMQGRYEIYLKRDDESSPWTLFSTTRREEKPMGQIRYSDEEFEALKKTTDHEEEWKAAHPKK